MLCKIVLASIHFLRQYSIIGFSVNVQNMSLKLGFTLCFYINCIILLRDLNLLVEAHYFDQCVNVGLCLCTCPLQDKKGDLIEPEVDEPKVKFLQLHVL